MRTCSIDGCDNKHYARGWCLPHYGRWQRFGDPFGQPAYFPYDQLVELVDDLGMHPYEAVAKLNPQARLTSVKRSLQRRGRHDISQQLPLDWR